MAERPLCEPGSKHAYQEGSRAWPSGLQMGMGIEFFFFFNKNVKKIQRENASKCSTLLLLVAKPVQLP